MLQKAFSVQVDDRWTMSMAQHHTDLEANQALKFVNSRSTYWSISALNGIITMHLEPRHIGFLT